MKKSVSAALLSSIVLFFLLPLASAIITQTITLSPATPLNDYQVKVILNSGNFDYTSADANGDDLRFFDNTNNALSYWIESWNASGNSVVWVKVAASGTSSFKMTYGDASLSAGSNASATMFFFDDFNDNLFDADKWQSISDGAGTRLDEINGELKARQQNNNAYWGQNTLARVPLNLLSEGYIVTFESRLPSLYPSTPGNELWITNLTSFSGTYSQPTSGGALVVSAGQSSVNCKISVTLYNATSTKITYKSELISGSCAGANIPIRTITAGTYPYYGDGLSAFNLDFYTGGYDDLTYHPGYWDNIRIRKFSVNEPVTTVGPGVAPLPICNENQTIMRLESSTNSRGALWNDAGTTIVSGNYDFGGMYGTNVARCDVGMYGPDNNYSNPLTNAFSCPSGYNSSMSMFPSEAHPLIFCYAGSASNPKLDFGGMYSNSTWDSSMPKYNNPITGTLGCPAGYTSWQVREGDYCSWHLDHDVHFCYKTHTTDSAETYLFGGMYSTAQINPITNVKSCPAGYTDSQVTSTTTDSRNTAPDFGNGLHICWKQNTQQVTQGYNYPICYTSVFGQSYNGDLATVHLCREPYLNDVIFLNSTNGHAKIPGSGDYPTPVCYGDLVCVNDSSAGNSCSNGGSVVVRLNQTTNSHVSNASDTSFLVKICCKRAAPATQDTYWSNMNDVKINSADLDDEVKLNVESSLITTAMNINYTVKKCEAVCQATGGAIQWFDAETAQLSGKGAAVWAANEAGEYYFIAKLPDGTEYNSFSSGYGRLVVSGSSNNKFPVVIMNKPDAESKHIVNSIIDFEQASYDEDDVLKAIWDFSDGNITTLLNCNNYGNCNTAHKYTLNGVKIIRLTAKEMRSTRAQENSTNRRIFLYSQGINAFAVISEPDINNIDIPVTGSVRFNASQSYIANCTMNICPSPLPAEVSGCYDVNDTVDGVLVNLKCFDYPKTGANGIGKTAGKYNLWFNWTFDEIPYNKIGNWADNYSQVVEFNRGYAQARVHPVSLMAGYEPF